MVWYYAVLVDKRKCKKIEHVNYYHIRLSYMSLDEIKTFIRQKGFRSSLLAKELKSIR